MRLAFERAGASAVRLSIAAAMVIAKACLIGENLQFPTSVDLCKEVSTKGKDNAAARGADGLHWRRKRLRSNSEFLTKLKLEVGYFTGRAWQNRDVGGAGVILRFGRILPR